MSVADTPVAFVVANDSEEINDSLAQGDPVAIEELIARVLGRAHRTAERFDAPDEARAIFHVAHSFADELAAADPTFDRHRFLRTVTNSGS